MFRRFLILPVVCFIAFVLSMPLAAQQAPAAQTTDATAKATETAAATAPAAKAADKVKLMIYDGEKAKVQLYGFIKLDAVYNTAAVAHEAGPMAVDNTAGLLPAQKTGSFTMEGRNTRLGLNFMMPEALGAKLTGVIEVDFWGQMPTNAAASNQSMIRMRHAYAKLVWPTQTSLLVGQFWSAAMAYESLPNMATFIPMGKCGLWFAREQQITVGQKIGDKTMSAYLDLSIARVQAGNDTGAGSLYPGTYNSQVDERGAGEMSKIPGFRGKLAVKAAPIDGLSVLVGTTGFFQREKQACAAWDNNGDSLFDTDGDGKNTDPTDTADIVTRTDTVNGYGFMGFLSVMYQMVGVSGQCFYGSNMDTFLSLAGTRAYTTNTKTVACVEARNVRGLKSVGGWGQFTFDLRKLPDFSLPFAINAGYGMENILNQYKSVAAGGITQNSCVFGNVFYYMNQYMSFAFEVSMMETCYQANPNAKNVWGTTDTSSKSPNNWSYHFAAQLNF